VLCRYGIDTSHITSEGDFVFGLFAVNRHGLADGPPTLANRSASVPKRSIFLEQFLLKSSTFQDVKARLFDKCREVVSRRGHFC